MPQDRQRPQIRRVEVRGSRTRGEPAGPSPVAQALFGVVVRWARLVPPAALALQRAMSANAYSDQPLPGWWLPGLGANLAQPKTQLAFSEEGAQIPNQELPDSAGLELPMLVIHGDDDRLVPVVIGRTLARNNPRAELLEIAGGSHMLPITHAGQLADRIAAFSAPPAPESPAAPPGADAGAPDDSPEHWMDVLASR